MRNKKILAVAAITGVLLSTNSVLAYAINATPTQVQEFDIEARTTYATVNQNTTMYTGKYYEGVVCSVPKGARVEIRLKDSDWCRVNYNHQIGYIKTSYLNF